MSPTLLPASPGQYSGSWVGRLLGPADFGDVIVPESRVQVSAGKSSTLSACGLWMLSSGPSPSVASPAPSQRPPGLGSACRGGAQLLLLVLLDFPHHLQEFCLASVLFFFRLVTPSFWASFQLQGSLLDLLIGVHAAHLRIRISKWTKVGGGPFSNGNWDSIVLCCRSGRLSLCGLDTNECRQTSLLSPGGFRSESLVESLHTPPPWRVATLLPLTESSCSAMVNTELKGDPLLSQGL